MAVLSKSPCYNGFMTVTRKRRWLQFSLKGMLVVMTLACVGLGWLAYERNEVRKRQEAIAAIKDLGAIIEFDEEQPFRPQWLRPVLGDTSAGEVVTVEFFGNNVTDAKLVHLNGLTKLERLDLDHTQVTDAGLVHLKGLTTLRLLYVAGTQVTDAGLVNVDGLTELEWLYLRLTQVSDAGLVHLKGLTKLERLDLIGTQVTEQGARELQKALPNVNIVR